MPLIDALDPDKIKANLNTKRIGKKILVYSCTSSTNDVAAEYAKNKKNDGLAIFAEQQAAGRGRAASKWRSGFAESILCSILLCDEPISSELLSLTCAVATAEAIHTAAKIKWPNDIILNRRKVAGILLESKTYRSHRAHILGIGINCHQKKDDFHPDILSIATSIDLETAAASDRNLLAKVLLSSIDRWLDTAEKSGQKVIDRFSAISTLLNQRITVIYNRRKFSGNCIGIDPQKGLILQLDTGAVRIFDAPHTTVAKHP